MGAVELCRCVMVQRRSIRSRLLIRSLNIRLTIIVSIDTFHSWLENRSAPNTCSTAWSRICRLSSMASLQELPACLARGTMWRTIRVLGTFHTSLQCALLQCCFPPLVHSSLRRKSPLHGHVTDVQREVARKCGLAHLLLF